MQVLQIQTPDDEWFAQRGITGNYHGGGNAVFGEEDVLSWVLSACEGGGRFMKVLLVNGSPHREGCTYTALGAVSEALNQNGIDTDVFWVGN